MGVGARAQASASENTRPGAFEIPSHVLVEWLWRTVTWPKIQREVEHRRSVPGKIVSRRMATPMSFQDDEPLPPAARGGGQ